MVAEETKILTKVCYNCKKDKSLDLYHIDRKTKTGRASYCKECAITSGKEWYKKSEKYRQIVRNSGLKARFGISLADYDEMLKAQNSVCAICKNRDLNRNLHVDHCHKTGIIRGLLCKTCNYGLGNFKDNTEYLENAIEYLDKISGSN